MSLASSLNATFAVYIQHNGFDRSIVLSSHHERTMRTEDRIEGRVCMFRACGSRRRVDYEGTGWCPGKGRPSVQCRDGRVVVRWRVGRGTRASLVLDRGGV